MVVSTMLAFSSGGSYETVNRDGEMLITYDGLYLNCIIIAAVYSVLSFAVSALVIRRREYK